MARDGALFNAQRKALNQLERMSALGGKRTLTPKPIDGCFWPRAAGPRGGKHRQGKPRLAFVRADAVPLSSVASNAARRPAASAAR